MVQPIDQGSVLRSGMQLVPDYAAQELDRRQVAAQEQQIALSVQRQQQALMEAQREQAQAEAFQAAMDDYLTDPDSPQASRKMASLLGRFPQFREQIEGAWKGLDSAKQNADLRSLGEIYSAGESGNFALAANTLQARIDAETASGMPADPTDVAMVQALKSGDPIQQRAAIRQAGLLLEVASGGKLSTSAKPTADEQNYEWRKRTFGKPYADRVQATQDEKIVPVQGIGLFRGSDFVDPAPSMGGMPLPGLISGYGGGTFNMDGSQATPSQYGVRGGGDPASDGGQEPLTFDQFQAMQQSMGANQAAEYIRRNGIPVLGPATGTTAPAPVRVVSKQQFDRLAKGTRFIAPDGTTRIK